MGNLKTDARFAIVPEWIILSGLSDRAIRLYAVLACHADYQDGTCNPGRNALARAMGCSVDTVDRAKAELVKAKAISVAPSAGENGESLRNTYVVHRFSPDAKGGRTAAAGGAARGGRTGAAQTREHLERETTTTAGARLFDDGTAPKRAKSVNGKSATRVENATAKHLLTHFNLTFETRFSSEQWLHAIIARCREHPELDLHDQRLLVDRAHDSPWWKDDPTPAVIWGNAKVFERLLNSKPKPKAEDRFARFRDF